MSNCLSFYRTFTRKISVQNTSVFESPITYKSLIAK